MVKKNKAKNNQSKNQKVVVKSAPAAAGTKVAANRPAKIIMGLDGTTTITHTEYVADVFGNNQNALTVAYPLNAQRTSTFPWLSAIASRFEVYKFERLVFHYKPSSGTSTSGYVIIAFDFDFYDSTTPTKAEVLTWKHSTKSAVWQSSTLSVSNDSRMAIWKYSDYTSRGDARLDMLGNIIVSSLAGIDTGSSLTTAVGELFVEYTVKFKQPSYKLPATLFGTSIANLPGSGNFIPLAQVGSPLGQSNMLAKWISQNVLEINETGRFLIQFGQAAATALTGLVSLVPSPIISSVADKFTLTFAESAHSTTDSMRTAILNVLTGGVRLQFTPNNNTGAGVVRIATYLS